MYAARCTIFKNVKEESPDASVRYENPLYFKEEWLRTINMGVTIKDKDAPETNVGSMGL